MNVKAYLAGKRGICPECDVRFIVPATSGGMVAAIETPAAEAEANTPEQAAVILPTESEATATVSSPAASEVPTPPPPPPKSQESTELLWYVRSSKGDQYGPATSEVFARWVEEGRVSQGCFVWRSDWPDWKPSSEALAEANLGDNVLLPSEGSSNPSVPKKTAVTSRHNRMIRNRRQRAKMITFVLSALAILLLIAVVLVVANG